MDRIIGIKFHNEIESIKKNMDLPILDASIEEFGYGEKLYPDRFVDPQVLKLFKEQGEHIESYNLIEAIFLCDNHIYRDTKQCTTNFIIANPNIKEVLENLIIYNGWIINKTCLYSSLVDSNEIICIHSDELMFPAHLESFAIKMDNPCLVKVITFSNDLPKKVKYLEYND